MYTLAVAVFAVVLWLTIDPPKRIETYTYGINETEMTIVEVETTTYTSEEIISRSCYYLLNAKKDTLAVQHWFYNPFVNARGIVYVPNEGVYDFRGQEPVLILKAANMANGPVRMECVDGKDQVRIICGSPFVNFKSFVVSDSSIHTCVYDLKEKKISKQE